jgi:hypothetical protein
MNRMQSLTLSAAPIAALALVNLLFAWKYLSRYSEAGLLVGLTYCAIFAALQYASLRIDGLRITPRPYWAFVIFMTGAWIALLLKVDPQTLHVDRWQMVQLWLDNLFAGKHPYLPLSDTTNIPGPFPFLYILALPAYLLHEIGYLNLAGYLLMAFWMPRYFGGNYRSALFAVASLSACLPIIYEVATRGTLLVNMILVLFYCGYLEKQRFSTRANIFAAGILGGLVLSTRSIVVVPLIIHFISLARRGRMPLRTAVMTGVIMTAVFIALLAPIYLWHPAAFMRYNPLAIQSILLPGWLKLALIALTISAGFVCRDLPAVIRRTGWLFFATVGLAFFQEIITNGWQRAFREHSFDISYFILSLPFLIIATYTHGAMRISPARSAEAQRDALLH